MITLQVDVLQKDPGTGNLVTLQKVNLQSSNPIFKLTPATLVEAAPHLAKMPIYGFNANIDCDKGMLQIEGFRYFSLSAFLNREPTIALLHASGATELCKLNNLSIKRLDVGESSLVLSGSTVGELNIGVSTVYQCQKEGKPIHALAPLKAEVRESTVSHLRVYVPMAKLALQRVSVGRMVLQRDVTKCDHIELNDNTSVDRLILAGGVGLFSVRHSKVEDLEFMPLCKVLNFESKASNIRQAHNCLPDTIANRSSESWRLVMDYAQSEHNASLYALAGYEYMKCERRSLKSFVHRLAYRLIEMTCGYGFRPLYTVLCAALVVTICGGLYWFLTTDLHDGIRLPDQAGMTPLETLGYSIYYSVVTFTTVGYGDVIAGGPIARALSCAEALSGVSLSTLFIFALTKRYGGFR